MLVGEKVPHQQNLLQPFLFLHMQKWLLKISSNESPNGTFINSLLELEELQEEITYFRVCILPEVHHTFCGNSELQLHPAYVPPLLIVTLHEEKTKNE